MRRICVMATLSFCGVLCAEVKAEQNKQPEPEGNPIYQSSVPQRKPLVLEESSEKGTPASAPSFWAELEDSLRARWGSIVALVSSAHQALSQHMPGPVAWVVVGSPLWLLLFFFVGRRLRRRRPRRMRAPSATLGAAPGKKAQPAGRERTSSGLRKVGPGMVPKKKEPSSIVLTPAHEILLARDNGAGSFFETFVAFRPSLEVLQCLRQAVRGQLEERLWVSTVKDAHLERLRPLMEQWNKEVAAQRLASWLAKHPLVSEQGLHVQLPGSLTVGELEGLTLTSADGLGITLGAEQQELLNQARRALAGVMERAAAPFPLLSTARQTGMSTLAGTPTPGEDNGAAQQPYALDVLLGGLASFKRYVGAGLCENTLDPELCDAFAEHFKVVSTPIAAEGCAIVVALDQHGRMRLPGVGTMLAAIAGAAYSTATVVLRISKQVGDLKNTQLWDALYRLGELSDAVLSSDEKSEEARSFHANLQGILGETLLQQEQEAAASLAKEFGRTLAKDPLWPKKPDMPLPPDIALLELYQAKVSEAAYQAGLARGRALDILHKLADGGQRQGEQQVNALRRLGYAVAGLGMPLLRTMNVELLSAGREVVSLLDSP